MEPNQGRERQEGNRIMYYFGTNLDSAGHYFWELEGNVIRRSDLYFDDIPFNPEELLLHQKGELVRRKGDVKFYQTGGYSICAIEGSCSDNRWGTRTVFFIKEDLTNEQLTERIKSILIAKKIIDKMPFKVHLP